MAVVKAQIHAGGRGKGRFKEHPELVLVFTNLPYREAAGLGRRPEGAGNAGNRAPDSSPGQGGATRPPRLRWRHVALPGSTAHDFDTRINAEFRFLTEHWGPIAPRQTGGGGAGQGSRVVSPWALVLYRADHAFALERAMGHFGGGAGESRPGKQTRVSGPPPGREGHDLVIAFQPYRSRLDAGWKVRNVLAPLARSLNPGGRMIAIQSTGRDPGMEIIETIWPGEDPFPTPRGALADALRMALAGTGAQEEGIPFRFEGLLEQESEFRFHLQLNPDDVESSIGTSTLLAAWNAAAYVAQMDEERVIEAMTTGRYLEATDRVLRKYHGLWFTDECFVVARASPARRPG